MEHTFLNVMLGFIEGLGLILSPCILPILPFILSGSLEGGKKRPLGIILGFIITFSLFTFFSKKLVEYSGVDLNLIRNISFGLLFLFGIVMLSSYLTEKFSLLTQRFANVGSQSASVNPQSGFIGGVLFGGLIGFIWTPCAGPILAAVIVQTVLQQTTIGSFLIILAFAIGAGVPMLLIALFGRAIVSRLNFFKQHSMVLRKILGVIILASVGWMFYGENASANLSSTTPQPATFSNQLTDGITPYPAPAIQGITAWINSQPLQLSQLKNKVVLIDFWAYSCINCIRTMPYLKDWYAKYHDKGFVIIGVHAPEFEFERDYNNVKNSAEKNGLTYPIALDNNFITWQNYNNRYWPAHYLIDKQGNVVYQHFGEGNYDITENNIRYLLGLNATIPTQAEQQTESWSQTPETYLGYDRADSFSSPESMAKDTVKHYTFPTVLNDNDWALNGEWNILSQRIVSQAPNAAIKIRFVAKKVFVVMGSATGKSIPVKVTLNGEAVVNEKGKDVNNGMMQVDQHTLYEAIVLKTPQTGVLELTALAPGLEIYTFTFGS
jgi:cytochrome c biogenesis protein CcdA/thiol-disulfide isomerase/thioredoxin